MDNCFRNVTLYLLLKYHATGLPRAGDVMPKDQLLWLSNAGPLELWMGFGIPIVISSLPPGRHIKFQLHTVR